MKRSENINRRKFILQATCGAGALGTLSSLTAVAGQSSPNPFAYDTDRYAKTDPKLIGYQEIRRFNVGSPEPRRIACGPDQQVYVAGRNGVTIFSSEGRQLSELPLAGARCLAVAPDGMIFAGTRDRIAMLDGKGRELKRFESPGKKSWFTGLAASGNELFAADSASRVILRYDRSGKILKRIGEKNKELNVPGLIVPSPYLDVELARDGLLRVNNPGRHRVEIYTADGDLEGFWGKPTAAVEGFCGCCNPIGIAAMPDGRWVTCEKGLPRVKVYSATGDFQSVVAGPEVFPKNARAGSGKLAADGTMGGMDAVAAGSGDVFVLDLVTSEVLVMKAKSSA